MPAQAESICIVDDDASVRNSIERLLDSDGLKAQSLEDAEVFFAHARSHAVSLAVLDVWMSETSGLQAQAQLREVSPGTKVIVMTGLETPAIRAVALEGGAFAFLVEPFDDEAFLSPSSVKHSAPQRKAMRRSGIACRLQLNRRLNHFWARFL